MAAYINQADVKNKASPQKDDDWASSREYLFPLKGGKNVILCKSMFLSTLCLKSEGMITEMVRAQRQSYDCAIASIEDCRDNHLPTSKCDAEVIRLHINSYNPAISHYKHKNAPYKQYLNPELLITEMNKKFSENNESNKICYKAYCNVFKSDNIGFHDLHKTSVKFASATKTISKILVHIVRYTQTKLLHSLAQSNIAFRKAPDVASAFL